MPPESASDRPPTDAPPSPESGPESGPRRMPLDEKLYLGFVILGLLVIVTIFAVTVLRSQREQAAARNLPPRQLLDFTLTERSGRTVSRTELDGRMLVVNFVFTSCGISCLEVNRHMTEIQRLTAHRSDVQLLSLTVDPLTDSPARLSTFARRFQADPNRWLFLTGDRAALYPLIETSFLGPAKSSHGEGLPTGMIHSDQIALVDATGRLRGLFNGLRPGVTGEVVQAIERWAPKAAPSAPVAP